MRAGVVGVGVMGQYHARIYHELDNVELVSIADVDEKRGREISELYNANYYNDYIEMINKEDIDLASICVPTSLHREVGLNVMNEGINVLIEKPIASNLKEADELINKAEEKDVKLMVGHVERYNPAVQKLKELIDKEELGKPIIVSTRRVGPFVPRVRDVGIIIDTATHDIDVISYLVNGKINSIYARAGKVRHRLEDHAIIILGFDNGVSGSVEVNWFTPHKTRKLTLTGTKAIAELDYITQELKIYEDEWTKIPKIEKKEPLKIELQHFIECVKKNEKPLTDGIEGKKILEIALKASESAKLGRTLSI